MKKLIILLLLTIGFVSCYSNSDLKELAIDRNSDVVESIAIMKYDSCEYLLAKSPKSDYGWLFTHKGNCKYCIQRQFNDTLRH